MKQSTVDTIKKYLSYITILSLLVLIVVMKIDHRNNLDKYIIEYYEVNTYMGQDYTLPYNTTGQPIQPECAERKVLLNMIEWFNIMKYFAGLLVIVLITNFLLDNHREILGFLRNYNEHDKGEK